MYLSWWRNLVKWVYRNNLTTRRDRRSFKKKFHRPAWAHLGLEQLEDRTLLSVTTLQWTPAGVNTNWSNPSNWTIVNTGTDTTPLAGDIAHFGPVTGPLGTTTDYTAAQTVTIDVASSVGEIDFGSTKNITISGANVLTFNNAGGTTPAFANLDVGASFANTGLDMITVPIAEFTPPVTGVITGGTLDLTNVSATANAFTAADSFTVNTGGTLEGLADVTNPALRAAGVSFNGGTLQLDAGAAASTLANVVTVTGGTISSLTTTGATAT